MSRERTTIDVLRFYVNYTGTWEHELDEYTPGEARKRRKEYAENCPQYETRIVKGREPVKRYYFYGAAELNGHRPACGLLRQENDPEGRYRIVYVYGRPLDREERAKSELTFLRTEDKKPA